MSYSAHSNPGGYVESSFDGSGNSGGYTRKPMGEQTLRPLTVKQIKNAEVPQENTFRIDSADVTQMTIVGVIRNIQELATNYVYTIEDGTGAIDVRKWVDQNETPEDADARRELTVDTYVRVNGRLNHFSNRTTVVAHTVRPIIDFNETTYHFLDAIRTHLLFTKDSVKSDPMNIDQPSRGNDIQSRVNVAIKSFEDSPDGATVDQICFKLKGLHTEAEVRETLEILIQEGQCYTTIDDDHYKSCLP
ncbi:Replication factor A protein 2 [Choanephora cucurbitarum]|uniref:Replication factor A protein 2 n=1 Tax=Choanephora cucurbitarum TaxID=101091 RepID=A0A1C7MZE0_9FUNG|nr:Replication factor A protein 2 [Choanephora cucurbitarum]